MTAYLRTMSMIVLVVVTGTSLGASILYFGMKTLDRLAGLQ